MKVSSLTTAKALKSADRTELVANFKHVRNMGNEWIRRQVLYHDRIDILAGVVLGMKLQPFHISLLRYQFQHPDNLQLAFRGAGKSTSCTITKVIHLLLKDPNLRILIASKTAQNASGFLKEIKNHFESNALLSEIFGEYYDQRKVTKWDSTEIEVLPRTKPNKEASITCVGVEGTIVSKHYDVIISDDLVDEENSRTKGQRDKTRTWYYQTLDPTLEPPDGSVPHRGEHHRLGTRYHYDDLYGHFIANELKTHHNIVPALDERGRSPWPEKYPPRWFVEKKQKSGLIIFNAQYQCDTEAMKGEIFQIDDCQICNEDDLPHKSELQIYMGVDLAIGEKEVNDKFAIVVIGVTKDRAAFYVLDYFEGQLRFSAQTDKILEYNRRWDPIRIAIETVAYQDAQYQQLKERNPDLRAKPVKTHKDKVTRAQKLSAIFEDKKMWFRKSHQLLIESLVLFPNAPHDDLFDGLDLAVLASKGGRRRARRDKEPGLI
jgi:predicted phage terminase large subunit-like protein